MKWKDAFPNPDLVGASEYLAIHDVLVGLLANRQGFNPNTKLSEEDLDTISSTLEEFQAWANKLLVACGKATPRKVVIHVSGGVATPVDWPADIVVEVRDYDTEGCNPTDLEQDGSLVGIYTKDDSQ